MSVPVANTAVLHFVMWHEFCAAAHLSEYDSCARCENYVFSCSGDEMFYAWNTRSEDSQTSLTAKE